MDGERKEGLKRSWSFAEQSNAFPTHPLRLHRSVSGNTSKHVGLEYCECGKNVFEPHRRARAWSTSCGSPQTSRSDSSSLAFQKILADEFSLDFSPPPSFSSSLSSTSAQQSTPNSPIGGRRTRSIESDAVDIEDVVRESGSDLRDLAEVAPKVMVTPKVTDGKSLETVGEEEEDLESHNNFRRKLCENCLRDDCVTVRPTVGYYSMEQVQKHCKVDDCWIVAHGLVYDVTRYLRKHPGGPMSILSRVGGIDASADYDFHTKYSKNKIWPKYKIGKLAVCPHPTARHSPCLRNLPPPASQESDSCCVS